MLCEISFAVFAVKLRLKRKDRKEVRRKGAQRKAFRKQGICLKVIETDRLILRWLSTDDAAFLLELMTDPSWLQFIGNKSVQTIEDARNSILNKHVEMYKRLGFGLYLTELKAEGVPIGICGLIKRDTLEDVDLGFAFLPKFRGKGYAYEAASATMEYGKNVLGLNRIVAITTEDNDASIKLLEKLGFQFEKLVEMSTDEKELMLFAIQFRR
ncbi:MAG TPA: GNAT family N-acetyltransferase [Pyrinomonadaceae bacterium]